MNFETKLSYDFVDILDLAIHAGSSGGFISATWLMLCFSFLSKSGFKYILTEIIDVSRRS